jgi:hypothetical protein
VPAVLVGQDQNMVTEGANEVVVTASRREADDYSSEIPAIGLKRQADFAVIGVAIMGDTRDAKMRQEEIYAMARAAISAASQYGVQLSYGSRVLTPLTLNNYKELSLMNDGRPDSQRLRFLVKVPLTGGMTAKTAQEKVTTYVKSVKPVGRALMSEVGDLELSIVAPDQYRGQVTDLIIADAKQLGEKLGPDYTVQIEGLNRPIEWMRAGLSDVFIYVPYRLVIGRRSS